MESTIHPRLVKVGDKLTVLYKNEEIEVTVITEPLEVDYIDEDDKGWWQCGVRWRPYPDDWYIVWTYDNPVWEIGPE